MEFKPRVSNTFIMNMFMIALALLMAFYTFFHRFSRYEIFNYSYLAWLLIAYIRLRNYWRYIYLMLLNKPVLIVNETYIYELAKNVK